VLLAVTALAGVLSLGHRPASPFVGQLPASLSAGESGAQAADAKVGDCIGGLGSVLDLTRDGLRRAGVLPCSQPHLYEVFFVGSIGAYGDAFAAMDWVDANCQSAFLAYVGVPFDQSPLNYFAVVPNDDDWAAGDRGVECVLADPNLSPLTTSMKQSRVVMASPVPSPSPTPSPTPSPSPSPSSSPSPTPSPSVGHRPASPSAGAGTGALAAGPKVGDCIGSPDGGLELTRDGLMQADVLPCSWPHLYEVFFVGAVDAFDTNFYSTYWSDATCGPAFQRYVGVPLDQSPLTYFGVGPDETAWAAGDHGAACVLADPNLSPLTKSMKGSGR
jgi:hypothetical protein